VQLVVPAHRFIFVFETAFMSVAGSLLAAEPQTARYWMLLIAAALGMFISDALGDVEARARELSRSTSKAIAQARLDTFDVAAPRFSLFLLFLSGLLLIAGLLFPGTDAKAPSWGGAPVSHPTSNLGPPATVSPETSSSVH
jgi:hypothetical protein